MILVFGAPYLPPPPGLYLDYMGGGAGASRALIHLSAVITPITYDASFELLNPIATVVSLEP